MPLATGLALALSAALTGGMAQASTPTFAQPGTLPAAQNVEQYVETYFADTPILIEVARCESHYTQYNADGSVHRGVVNNQDVGIMQINEHYQLATAEKLGLDIYSIQGNLAYAKYLYEKEGTQPWSSSKPCWGSDEVAIASNK
jgi:hypothetical protein